jgi:hypothetical protein
MFLPTSRYYLLETATMVVTDENGDQRMLAYKRRRFLPPAEGLTTLAEHTFTQGDRLDNITARYLDVPTEFWRICDANNVLRPAELEEVGRIIKIAFPVA